MTTDTVKHGADEDATRICGATQDAGSLTPQQRRAEVAAILATGLRRLHARTALSAPRGLEQADFSLDSAQDGLDVPAA